MDDYTNWNAVLIQLVNKLQERDKEYLTWLDDCIALKAGQDEIQSPAAALFESWKISFVISETETMFKKKVAACNFTQKWIANYMELLGAIETGSDEKDFLTLRIDTKEKLLPFVEESITTTSLVPNAIKNSANQGRVLCQQIAIKH